MRLPVLLVLLLMLPFSAVASGGGEAVFAILGMQVLVSLWPLVLPILFITYATHKFKAYVIFLLFVYGILGVLNLPLNMFFQLSIFIAPDIVRNHSIGITLFIQLLGFVISLVFLQRNGKRIAAYLDREE